MRKKRGDFFPLLAIFLVAIVLYLAVYYFSSWKGEVRVTKVVDRVYVSGNLYKLDNNTRIVLGLDPVAYVYVKAPSYPATVLVWVDKGQISVPNETIAGDARTVQVVVRGPGVIPVYVRGLDQYVGQEVTINVGAKIVS